MDIQRLQREIKDAEEKIERMERLERLYQNTDFQELILKYFMKDECARYIHQSVDSRLPETQRENAMGMAQTSGYLKEFFSLVEQFGNQAREDMPDKREELIYLRSGGEEQ